MRNHTTNNTQGSIPDSHVKTVYEEAAEPATADGEARRGHSAGAAEQRPPTSNTGALIHPTSCIDWLQFTIRTPTQTDRDYFFRRWAKLLGGSVPMERNMFGYDRVHSVLGTGFILWHKTRLDMGLHISLPASAINVYSQFAQSETAVYELMIEARNDNAKFTRIDVAHDTGAVKVTDFLDAIERGELVTRSRSVLLQKSLLGGEGMTIYIGSSTSDRRVRIYDKAAQTGTDGTWTRIETQYRKKYADQVVDKILLSDISLELLAASSFDFREVGNTRTNNRERANWWANVLGQFEKVMFVIKNVIGSLEKKALWLENAIMPTLAAVFLKLGHEWFERAMDNGVERISPINQVLIYQT